MDALRKEKRYTYADYLEWDDGKRRELIGGVAYEMFPSQTMSPAPSWEHQGILVELAGQIREYLKGKHCKVFVAPFDVRLNAETTDDTVVQPDLVVICDRTSLSGTGYMGVPDLVMEVLSPSTAAHDRFRKFNLYLRHGVREYWIVDPDSKTVSAHVLENGRYYTTSYAETDTAPVGVLEGCVIDLAEVFL